MLLPISNNHSISKAIATIFVPQSFIKPKLIFDKIIEKGNLNHYQNRSHLPGTNVSLIEDTLTISDKAEDGFFFEEFNDRGKSINILRIENIPNKKAVITFENSEYANWQTFINRFFNDMDSLRESVELFVEAVNLTYIDEFLWNSPERIKTDEIFNISSNLLNTKFLNSDNGTTILITQNIQSEECKMIEEKTEIIFNNQYKRIIINHSYALILRDLLLYAPNERDPLISLFNKAHSANKEILKQLLTANVLESINL